MTSAESNRNARWARRAGEGITIVVSILLALAADAAWSWRGDRVEERQLLEGLRTEFAGAANEVANDLEARTAIIQRTELLLDARRRADVAIAADSFPAIVAALIDWRFYTPAHAVLDDALSSGRLDLIRSDDVRRALMVYVQERSRVAVFDQLERDFVTDQIEPYLAARIPLDRVLGSQDDARAGRIERRQMLALIADNTFGSLLQIRRERTQQAVVFSRIVRDAIADVRATLDATLGTPASH